MVKRLKGGVLNDDDDHTKSNDEYVELAAMTGAAPELPTPSRPFRSVGC